MLSLLVFAATTASVPTPSQALLAQPHPAAWTQQLIAQADDRDAEIKALEEDMERSRERLGHPKQTAPEATPAPAPAPRAQRVAPDPTFRPTYEGHTRGYYLTWGIVDWVLAGQLWGIAAYTGLIALIAGAIASGEPDAGLFALIYGGIAIGSGALGGVAAWRAVTNIRIYRDLKSQERAHRTGRLPGPRR